MNKKLTLKYLGYLMVIEGAFMIPAMLIALIRTETPATFGFAGTIAVLLAIGGPLLLLKAENQTLYAKDGFFIVALSWIVLSLFGALPFRISGAIPSFVDAFFETVSGFTTTGSSILTEIESLPMSILYWRSFTHWLGGMGVLVFILAVIPKSAGSGVSLHILRAESPGPVVGKLVPKMRSTARLLYSIYIVMTIMMAILLLAGGMPLFDAVTVSFGTAGTGGFAITNNSIAAYDSYYLQGVITVFMLLFSVNFNIYFLLLMKEFRAAFKDTELRVFLGIVGISILAIAVNIYQTGQELCGTFFSALHHSAFQVSTIISTTGFASVDFNQWPTFSKMILMLLMFIGASAGSTGGGMKVSRVIILGKSMLSEIKKLIHPSSVRLIRVNGKVVSPDVVHSVNSYLAAYVAILVVSTLLLSLENFSFETTFSAVVACFNNIGPGFDMVGATGNYSAFTNFGKLVLCADMLLGRLEIFPILILFSPSLWRRTK
ncbi:MAG: TrkH family potassium uptake protein [Clostridia bacterium]|nr:TrkH family potassium uptake protein [Clostridia bacterium]